MLGVFFGGTSALTTWSPLLGVGAAAQEGMTVYNTNVNVAAGLEKGFYYWNGAKWIRIISDATTADNGLTKTGNNIQLGGALTKATVVTATATNTLALAGLQTGVATDKIVTADPTTGVLKSVPAKNLGWLTTGNAGTAPATNFLGTTDNYPLNFRTNNTQKMTILPNGNVGIGTTAPNTNAILDVNSSTKGLLLPRVALTSINAAAPLTAHVEGMIVYNTATTGDVTSVIYYNDGTRWNKLVDDYNLPVYSIPRQVLSATVSGTQNVARMNEVNDIIFSIENVDYFNTFNGTVFTVPAGQGGTYSINCMLSCRAEIQVESWFSMFYLLYNQGSGWSSLIIDTKSNISGVDQDNSVSIFWSGALVAGDQIKVGIISQRTAPNIVKRGSFVITKI